MSAATAVAPLLEIQGATKNYGAVRAIEDVSFTVGAGEVVALLGDNGAGKSTLIKALSGVHQLDEGRILLNGEPLAIREPSEARKLGIETLHQDLSLFDNLPATANFFIGRERKRAGLLGRLGWLDEKAMRADWERHLDTMQVRMRVISGDVGVLSGGQRQAIAVMRAVAFASKLVILDEPTAALGVRESYQVLELVRRLPEHGIAVILISHNLEHVMKVADRAVVLRQGRCVGEAPPTPEHHERLVSLIVGASLGAGGAANHEGGDDPSPEGVRE
jgi:D-xylose transport system ATP-binding protein